MIAAVAIDTSVAIPLLVREHQAHGAVVRWWDGRPLALCGHAAVETYAVLTRLPGDLRVAPTDAATLITARFGAAFLLSAKTHRRLPALLSRAQIAGGATYDALVALAAREHGATLATRDARARDTYEKVGASVTFAV